MKRPAYAGLFRFSGRIGRSVAAIVLGAVERLVGLDQCFAETALQAQMGETQADGHAGVARQVGSGLAQLFDSRLRLVGAQAPEIEAELLAAELGFDEAWQTEQVQLYRELAAGYLLQPDKAEAKTAPVTAG